MELSPPTRPMGRASIAVLVAIGLLLIAGVLTAVKTTWAPLAHADAQPTVTVVLKPESSTSAQSVYTVTASGFAPQVSITQTLGDGSAVPPIAGHTNASGMFTSWWTLEVASKYCGTITAKTDTAQASASFWVAPPSDPSSGTACVGTAGSANTNPPPAATAAATAAPSHASPVATSAAQQASPLPSTTPAAADSTAPGFSLRALTAHLPWRWIGLGGVAVLGLIVVVAVASGRRAKSPPRRGRERASGQGRAVYGRGQQAGMGGGAGMRGGQPPSWQQAPPRADSYVPHREPEPPRTARGYVPHREPEPRAWPTELRPMARRDAAAPPGTSDYRHPAARRPEPDQRWSRSQPGARTLRDATVGRQRAVQRHQD
ncbi:MAG: hypothetical protein PVSMB4_07140 [Ktedonobacterales bacterium]